MDPEKKISKRKYNSLQFLTRIFFSVMGQSQVTSPADDNLDFDDDNLKGKSILHIIQFQICV